MARVFLIDTDTASDDAVALIMALRAPDVRVAAITTVAGNVNVEQSTRNALYTAELCEADVPVYMGADKPLLRRNEHAMWFHGRDGLGDHGYPAAKRAAEKLHAVDAIIEKAWARLWTSWIARRSRPDRFSQTSITLRSVGAVFEGLMNGSFLR